MIALFLLFVGVQGFYCESNSFESSHEDVLRRRVRSVYGSIESIRIKYRTLPTGNDKNRQYTYREIIAKYPCSLWHFSSHGSDRIAWQDDVFSQLAIVRRHDFDNHFLANRTFFKGKLVDGDRFPGTLKTEFIFVSTGIWPFDEAIRPSPNSFKHGRMSILGIVDSDAYVLQESEDVNSERTFVLERKGRDKIWFDFSSGHMIAREIFDAKGHLMARYELTEYKRCNDAIEFPRLIRFLQYDANGRTRAERARLVSSLSVEIIDVSINDVTDGEFLFPLPHGCIEIDKTGLSGSQVTIGTADYLNSVSKWIVENAPPKNKATSKGSFVFNVSLAAIGICLFAGLFVKFCPKF